MKTHLPFEIKTVFQAKTYLYELVQNNEAYHPDDDAHDIDWHLPDNQKPTPMDCMHLNKLRDDIFNLPECELIKEEGKAPYCKEFDPYGYILDLQNFNQTQDALKAVQEIIDDVIPELDGIAEYSQNEQRKANIILTDTLRII